MSRARTLAPASRHVTILLAATLLGGLVTMVAGVAVANRWLVACGLVLTLLADLVLPRVDRVVLAGMQIAGLDAPLRTTVRVAAVVALVALVGGPARTVLLLSAGLMAARLLDSLQSARLRRRASAAVSTRNVDIGAPADPHRALESAAVPRLAPAEALVLVPVLLGASTAVVGILGGLGLVWAAAVVVRLQHELGRLGARLSARHLIPATQRFLDAHRPEVVMYFSGGALSTYQLDTWLTTLERLDERTVIILRERAVLDTLGPTTVPVLCVPDAEDLMLLRFPTVRVALYAANVGKNIHFLRLPGIYSAFVGHGDSDKNASFNPFTRVYDEVWVAGPAGRTRYERAAIGVRDEQIVEVGRPQLDRILGTPPETAGPRTVLYAPTWEGWNSDQDYTSIPGIGVELARRVLADPELRLVYRPHPFAGRRLASVRTAHEQIVAMIEEADGLVWSPSHDAAGARAGALEQEAARDAAYGELLGSGGTARPVAIVGAGADVLACFRATHGLVTDVSSVLSDFVATGKPIAVGNPRGAAAADFTAEFPSTRAATLLTRDGEGLDSFLDVVAGRAVDVDASVRAELRQDLLGPAAPSLTRFETAIRELAARADAWHGRRTGASSA